MMMLDHNDEMEMKVDDAMLAIRSDDDSNRLAKRTRRRRDVSVMKHEKMCTCTLAFLPSS
jgi:hypothetical protein